MAIETVKIKVGQIFEVEGKMYMVALPKTSSQTANDHGQVVILLKEIE